MDSFLLDDSFASNTPKYSHEIFAGNPHTHKVLADDELLLGFRNLWTPDDISFMSPSELRHEIVKFPIHRMEKPKNMLCTGGNGSGKSYHLGYGVCVDQIIRDMRDYFNILFVDPAGEYTRMNALKPESEDAWRVWERIDRTPKFPAHVEECIPFVVADDDNRDASFKLRLEKIRKQDLITLLDLTGDKEDDVIQLDILRDAFNQYAIDNDLEQIPNPLCPCYTELLAYIEKVSKGSKVLIRKIKNLKGDGYIGEEDEGFFCPDFRGNLYKNMPLGSIQAVQTTLDTNLSWELAGLVNFIIGQVRDEQDRRYKLAKDGKEVVHMNTILVIDEYQKVYRRKLYNNLYNACGKLLLTIFGLLPSLGDLKDDTPLRQSEILICSRIDETEIPKVRSIAGDLAYFLSDLQKVPGKNYGQFAYIYKGDREIKDLNQSDVIAYYPPQTLTDTYLRIAKPPSKRTVTIKVPSLDEPVIEGKQVTIPEAVEKAKSHKKKKLVEVPVEEPQTEDETDLLPTLPLTPTPKKNKKPQKTEVIVEPQPVVQIIREIVKQEPREEPKRLARHLNPKEEKLYEALKEIYAHHYEGKGEWKKRIKDKGINYGMPVIEDIVKWSGMEDKNVRTNLKKIREKGWLEGDVRTGLLFTQEEEKLRYGERYKPKKERKEESKKLTPMLA
jgi:hypothetical protein